MTALGETDFDYRSITEKTEKDGNYCNVVKGAAEKFL